MRGLRYLWLLVPALGVLELGLHLWFAGRAPTTDEWRAARVAVARAKRVGEPLVIAPEWAEPLARHAFGDALFPLSELARGDDEGVSRVLEVSALGARNEPTRGWRVRSESRAGRFTLRELENPSPRVATYRFIEHVRPGELEVALVHGGEATPCPYTDQARVTAGGLHGQVAFPRERFACGGYDSAFVGITIIDDQDYRPRRCIWAQPPPGGALRLTFARVPLGNGLRGFAGLSYFIYRDSDAPPVTLEGSADGAPLGRYTHHDASGWHPFRFDTTALSGHGASVVLELTTAGSEVHDFCFTLEAMP